MSLYGDLPVAKDDAGSGAGAASWSGATNAKMLPPPALRKRALNAPAMAPPTVRRRTDTETNKTAGSSREESGSGGAMGTLSGSSSATEYDPARPNDYQQVRQERERLRQEAEVEAERQVQLREAEERQAQEQRLVASSPQQQAQGSRESALKLSGEEAFLRRGSISRPGGASAAGGGVAVPPPASLGLGSSASSGGGGAGGMSAAQRMMAKMGWKEGQGLGRTKQGMTTPLMAQKTDTHAAVIVNAQPTAPPPPAAAAPKKAGGVSFQGTPTTVVLLRNMVGPGEVDEALEDEVAEECTKYGQVNRVLIFEVTEAGFPPTEAVRIFIQFDKMESAVKALVDLEGRFFGGRVVRATFFSEDRLDAHDLAPLPQEIGA